MFCNDARMFFSYNETRSKTCSIVFRYLLKFKTKKALSSIQDAYIGFQFSDPHLQLDFEVVRSLKHHHGCYQLFVYVHSG